MTTRPVPKAISHFATKTRPVADWVIPRLLKRKNTMFVLGEPKRAVKSWLMLNLAWDLALGKPVWGICDKRTGEYVFTPERPMRVLYFTQEDTEDDLHDRVDILTKGGRPWTEDLLYVSKNLNLRFEGEGVKIIREAVEAVAPVDLIIFDTFRRMHSQSENDSEIIAKIYQIVDSFHQTYNCSTAFVHHLVKPPTASDSLFDPASPHAGRGSGDIFGGADSFINVVPQANRGKDKTERLVTLHFENKRSRPLPPTQLSMNFDTGHIEFKGFGDPRRAANSGEDFPHL